MIEKAFSQCLTMRSLDCHIGLSVDGSEMKKGGARKQILVKAGSDRGRKQLAWSFLVQKTLVSEFERLSKAGLNFNGAILWMLAKRILINKDEQFDVLVSMAAEERRLTNKITKRWVRAFMEIFNFCLEGNVASLWCALRSRNRWKERSHTI